MNYWLIKSEPNKYSWDDFVELKRDHWDGVRNYAARLNLMAMKEGDLCLFYHSNIGKEIVGVAKVVREHYPDPTTEDDRWVVVDVVPEKKLKKPVTLAEVKSEPELSEMELVRLSRLSVSKVSPEEYRKVMEMAGE